MITTYNWAFPLCWKTYKRVRMLKFSHALVVGCELDFLIWSNREIFTSDMKLTFGVELTFKVYFLSIIQYTC